ncbi:MAG: hypothetical protein Q9169_008247, partial [Polycauliona sp. 2 TL-2023]
MASMMSGQMLNADITFRSVPDANHAQATDHAGAQRKLTDLGKLVVIRKSLTGSDLAVADLDQIIAKTIEDIQQDASLKKLNSNPTCILEQLNSIRIDMVTINFDLTDEYPLTAIQVGSTPDSVVHLAQFTAASLFLKTKAPVSYLQLAHTYTDRYPKDSIFKLFDGSIDLYATDNTLGFKTEETTHACWSQESNIIRVTCRTSPHEASRMVFLKTVDERSARSLLNKLSDSGLLGRAILVQCET